MRVILMFVLTCLLLTGSTSILAQDSPKATRTEFSFEPEVNYGMGETQYDMTWVFDPNGAGVVGIRSLLEFPLNSITVGGTVRMKQAGAVRHPLGVSFTAITKINDPSGKMKDGDWYILGSGTQYKFSYTESNAKLSYFVLNVEGSVDMASRSRAGFVLVGGLRYQRIEQDIFGYSGWYDDGGQIIPVSGTEHALYYKVTYTSPFVGLRFRTGDAKGSRFHVQAALAPTHMSDFDDHLLRFKSATASGWGTGILAESGFRFPLRKSGPKSSYLELRARFNYAHASPHQTQHWYGDDPASPEDDTGLTLEGVPHEITLTELNFGVKLGFGL